ncbi:MAG: DUF1559 domain-containing protein [Planctomycetaceae bacterium]
MVRPSRHAGVIGSGLLSIALGVGWLFAQPDAKEDLPDPLTLLPQHSLIFVATDGHAAHSDAWEQTSAHRAIDDSGLSALVDQTLDSIEHLAEQLGAGPVAGMTRQFLSHVRQQGFSFGATVRSPNDGPPSGYAVLVLHQAADFEVPISQLVQGVAAGELPFQTISQHGREVTFALIPDSPGVEVGWWQERGHLVIVAGIDAVGSALAVMTGESPNVTSNPLYAKYIAAEQDFEVVTRGWLDVERIRGLITNIPLPVETGADAPGPLTVGTVIELLGFDNLNAIVSLVGYKGPAMWNESWVDAPGKRKGLLALAEEEPIRLDELPPMPFAMNSFTATRVDPGKLYDRVLSAVRKGARYAPDENAKQQVDDILKQGRDKLGMDVRTDLLEHMGGRVVGYDDSRQGLFNMGAGFLLELKDPAAFKAGMDQLLTSIEKLSEGTIVTRRVERQGREVLLLMFQPSPFGQSFCIDGKWLVIGSPQVIESYLLRVDGKLPRWTPSPEHAEAFAALPEEFSSIAVSDPRGFVNLLAGLAPLAIGGAEMMMQQSGDMPPDFEFPVHLEDFPPAELISQPLFPNATVVEVTPDGLHMRSRTSLPAIPLIGSGDAVTATAVVAVGVALLLPAVQQARMAARRVQSQNNLKQQALALLNYEATYGHLPSGTILNANLTPEQRLSWVVELLPYIEFSALSDRIDRSAGWADGNNVQAAATALPTFMNPGLQEGETTFDDDGRPLGMMQYVGIGGLGEDGPLLKVNDPKAGLFGYDRQTRFRDVKDGLSNTVMISEAYGLFGGWMQGGRATIRPLTEQPYINGPDEIGGPFPGGANMSFADGSVRQISQEIDPTVMEAITTIAGSEVVGDF